MSENLKQEIPQLLMLRDNWEGLPSLELPTPYCLRSLKEGDGKAWEEIIMAAFGVNPGYDMLKEDPAFRPERVWFVTDGSDIPIATASCWTTGDYPSTCSVLHMVGIRPEHGGRHLGQLVTAAAMHEAAREGFQKMALRTDPFRIPAIKTYLRLGFRPQIIHEAHIDLWKKILRDIGENTLADCIPEIYHGQSIADVCG